MSSTRAVVPVDEIRVRQIVAEMIGELVRNSDQSEQPQNMRELPETISDVHDRALEFGRYRIGRNFNPLTGGVVSTINWKPHSGYDGEPMEPGQFRDPPDGPVYTLALAAGALVIATDGDDRLRHQREAVLAALKAVSDARIVEFEG